MRKYPFNAIEQDLVPWPFEGESSNYQIVRGNPQASRRIDVGASGGQHQMSIWCCTKGAFSCIEVGDELQTVISGRLTITRDDGESINCGPGDSVFTRKREHITWDIQETVIKVFFTYNASGEEGQWN